MGASAGRQVGGVSLEVVKASKPAFPDQSVEMMVAPAATRGFVRLETAGTVQREARPMRFMAVTESSC